MPDLFSNYRRWIGLLTAGLLLAACAGPAATNQPTQPAQSPDRSPTEAPSPLPTSVLSPNPTASPPGPTPTPVPPADPPTPEPAVQGTPLRLEILEGSEARYLVTEQFARRDFPNDAVGETPDVEGTLVLDANGQVQPELSRITVNVRTLRSDEDDRDDFLRTDALETDRYPTVEFVVQQAPGLPWPLPEGEDFEFELQGDMTAHGVTAPITWQASAAVNEGVARGQARTNFTFDTFNMVKPSVFFLLSVEDNIRLEIDFVAVLEEMEDSSPPGEGSG